MLLPSFLPINMCTHPQFEPFIHEPASPHVHHILIYECGSAVDLSNFTDEQLRGGPCYTNPSVLPLTTCMLRGSVVAGWAVGGEVSSLCTSGRMLIGHNTILQNYNIIMLYLWCKILQHILIFLLIGLFTDTKKNILLGLALKIENSLFSWHCSIVLRDASSIETP